MFGRKRKRLLDGQNEKSEEHVEAGSETVEDNVVKIQRRSNHKNANWMDDVVEQHRKEGGFDHLPGKGKQLNIDPNADVFSEILRNAGAVPPWIALQHEIRDDIERAVALKDSQPSLGLDSAVAKINEKIRRFNTQCPSSILQKKYVSTENVVQRLEDWR